MSQNSAVPRRYGSIHLDTGWHAIEVEFLGNSVKDSLSMGWSYPGLIQPVGNLLIPNNSLVNGEVIPVATLPGSGAGQTKAWVVGRCLMLSSGLHGAEIRLYNARGIRVLRKRNASSIDISSFPPGIYWMEGRTEKGRIAAGMVPVP
jgi:hypothetical protein